MKNSNLFQRIGWLSAMALTVAAVAASCSQDELVNGTGKDNPVIGFGISAARTENDSLRTRAANSEEESPVILLGQKGADTLYLHTLVEDNTTLPSPEQLQTRGVPVTTNNFGDICHSFNVTAYTPDGAVYMQDIEVGTVSNNVWSPNDGTHYWPDNMELHFYAYAPHDGLFSAEGETQTAAPGSKLEYGMTDGKPNGSTPSPSAQTEQPMPKPNPTSCLPIKLAVVQGQQAMRALFPSNLPTRLLLSSLLAKTLLERLPSKR